MKKINFKRFEMYVGISRKETVVRDCREAFANIIYLNGSGVACHALAMKIYESDGETEYSEEEISLMNRFVESFGTLSLRDSFNMNVLEIETIENNEEKRKEEQA